MAQHGDSISDEAIRYAQERYEKRSLSRALPEDGFRTNAVYGGSDARGVYD